MWSPLSSATLWMTRALRWVAAVFSRLVSRPLPFSLTSRLELPRGFFLSACVLAFLSLCLLCFFALSPFLTESVVGFLLSLSLCAGGRRADKLPRFSSHATTQPKKQNAFPSLDFSLSLCLSVSLPVPVCAVLLFCLDVRVLLVCCSLCNAQRRLLTCLLRSSAISTRFSHHCLCQLSPTLSSHIRTLLSASLLFWPFTLFSASSSLLLYSFLFFRLDFIVPFSFSLSLFLLAPSSRKHRLFHA